MKGRRRSGEAGQLHQPGLNHPLKLLARLACRLLQGQHALRLLRSLQLPLTRVLSTRDDSLRSTWRRRLAQHYAQGLAGSLSDVEEQAGQELRWLEKAARSEVLKTGETWESRVERMVREMVEEDKPLAYVLGERNFHCL